MKKKWKKLIAPLCLVLVLAGCGVWILLQHTLSVPGKLAQVRVDGQTALELPLAEDFRGEVTGAEGIRLVVVVSGGRVYVESSQCPDKICVHRGKISSEGETIVCMPAKTIIEVVN